MSIRKVIASEFATMLQTMPATLVLVAILIFFLGLIWLGHKLGLIRDGEGMTM